MIKRERYNLSFLVYILCILGGLSLISLDFFIDIKEEYQKVKTIFVNIGISIVPAGLIGLAIEKVHHDNIKALESFKRQQLLYPIEIALQSYFSMIFSSFLQLPYSILSKKDKTLKFFFDSMKDCYGERFSHECIDDFEEIFTKDDFANTQLLFVFDNFLDNENWLVIREIFNQHEIAALKIFKSCIDKQIESYQQGDIVSLAAEKQASIIALAALLSIIPEFNKYLYYKFINGRVVS